MRFHRKDLYRLDLSISAILIITPLIMMIYLQDIRFQLAILSIPVGSFLYALSIFYDSEESKNYFNSEYEIHTVIFILLSIAATVSPLSMLSSRYAYYPLIGIIAGLISILVVYDAKHKKLVLFQIVLLSILVRGAVYFQFPSIPGIDTPNNHIPIILRVVNTGMYIPTEYHSGFPISHLQGAIGMMITEANIKDSVYLSIFLPEAISVVLIYIFVRRVWSRNRGLISSLFISVTPYGIVAGIRRVPQAISLILLPVLLYCVFCQDRRKSMMAYIIFLSILLSHNAQPWILLFMICSITLIHSLSSTKEIKFEAKRIAPIIFAFGLMKFQHIWTSDYLYNIGRILNTLRTIIGEHSRGEAVPLVSESNTFNYALARFASMHILTAVILSFLSLYYLRKVEVQIRGHGKEMLTGVSRISWFIPVVGIWAFVGISQITSLPRNTKIFSPIGIFTAPLVYDFVNNILLSRRMMINIIIFILIIGSISSIGTVHPRSNVDDFNRPGKIALDSEELSVIKFTSKMPDENRIYSPQPMYFYDWKVTSQMIPIGLLREGNRTHEDETKLMSTDSSIYDNGDQGVHTYNESQFFVTSRAD